VIDLATKKLKTKIRVPVIDPNTGLDIPVDMPNFNGDAKPCRYSYFLGASRPEGWFPFRSIVKLDLHNFEALNWDAGDGQVVSEPMFVPRVNARGEDDGFVVSIVHNAEDRTCRLVVFDSLLFEAGPIASIDLGALMPWCVHGSWYPEYNP
jgi:carotenoid cleavage dioxygenase